MTNKSLAILAPRIGVVSETFIRRHIMELYPSNTVVITRSDRGKDIGFWGANCPILRMEPLWPSPIELYNTLTKEKEPRIIGNSFYRHRRTAIKAFLEKHEVSVILGEYLDFSYHFIDIAKELGISIWGHALGYDVSRQLKIPQWCKNYLRYNQTAGIITVSEVSKNRLIELGIIPSKIHVIPCGVIVPNEFSKKGGCVGKNGVVRCLAVGRMIPKKGPLFLLEGFRQAIGQYPQLHLDYVGTGSLLPTVRQFIQVHNLTGSVTLHYSIQNKEVHELMRLADMFLQHSLVDPDNGDEEGLPVAILDAMANGLPVISTRHAGIPEAVIERNTGLLVNEGDSSGMGACIIKLANDRKQRIQFGFAGWERAKKEFSWKLERTRLMELLGL